MHTGSVNEERALAVLWDDCGSRDSLVGSGTVLHCRPTAARLELSGLQSKNEHILIRCFSMFSDTVKPLKLQTNGNKRQ